MLRGDVFNGVPNTVGHSAQLYQRGGVDLLARHLPLWNVDRDVIRMASNVDSAPIN